MWLAGSETNLVWASRDVCLTRATTASPPADRGVSSLAGVRLARTIDGERDVGDLDSGRRYFLNPLLDEGGVGRRDDIEFWEAECWRVGP